MRVIEGQPSRASPTRPVERGRHDCGPPKWGATIRVRPAATSLRSGRMDDPSVRDLLQGAAGGDEASWTALVDRFASLVGRWHPASSSTGGRSRTSARRCGCGWPSTVGASRSPSACPAGWRPPPATRRCGSCDAASRSSPRTGRGTRSESPVEDPLLGTETLHELLQAFNGLDGESQQLLRLLCVVPPLDYRTISEITGRPVADDGRRRADGLRPGGVPGGGPDDRPVGLLHRPRHGRDGDRGAGAERGAALAGLRHRRRPDGAGLGPSHRTADGGAAPRPPPGRAAVGGPCTAPGPTPATGRRSGPAGRR